MVRVRYENKKQRITHHFFHFRNLTIFFVYKYIHPRFHNYSHFISATTDKTVLSLSLYLSSLYHCMAANSSSGAITTFGKRVINQIWKNNNSISSSPPLSLASRYNFHSLFNYYCCYFNFHIHIVICD